MPPWDKDSFGHSFSSKRPYSKLLKMKTTTKTCNNQKISERVPEESVEAI